MDRLIEWILHAKEEKANEILIAPQSPMRARSGRELKSLTDRKMLPAETRALLLGFLDEEQRHQLETLHHVHGVAQVDQIQFRFSVDRSLNGLVGAISWMEESSLDNSKWEFHPSLIESLNKTHGLVVVSGVQGSGKTSALHSLIWKHVQSSNRSMAFFSDYSDWSLPESNTTISFFSAEALKIQPDLAQYADVIVLDSQDLSLAAAALHWAETGKLVILSVAANDWTKGLERIADSLQSEPSNTASQIWRRLSQTLVACIGLKLVKGSLDPLVGLHELLLVDSGLRCQLMSKDFLAMQETIRVSGEKNGMRTMNQSILQAILKRKIELRTGFDASPDPGQLDLVLKKIGI